MGDAATQGMYESDKPSERRPGRRAYPMHHGSRKPRYGHPYSGCEGRDGSGAPVWLGRGYWTTGPRRIRQDLPAAWQSDDVPVWRGSILWQGNAVLCLSISQVRGSLLENEIRRLEMQPGRRPRCTTVNQTTWPDCLLGNSAGITAFRELFAAFAQGFYSGAHRCALANTPGSINERESTNSRRWVSWRSSSRYSHSR